MYVLVKFDGAAKGNAAPSSRRSQTAIAAYGFEIISATGNKIYQEGKRVNVSTSNEAEFHGLLAALTWLTDRGDYQHVKIQGDSELVISTINGTFRISQKPHLARLIYQLSQRIACRSVETDDPNRRRLQLDPVSADGRLVVVKAERISRKRNAVADKLAGKEVGSR